MGLDMYLNKKNYVGAKYEHRKVTGEIDIKIGDEPLNIDFKKVSYIIEESIYWRKANSIHAWFVANVQDGDDNCRAYYVSYEQLTELKNICQKVVDSLKNSPTKKVKIKTGWADGKDTFEEIDVFTNLEKVEELLPPQSGFFFGSNEVDEYYLKEMKSTIEEIAGLDPEAEYEYSSSW